MKTEDEYKGCLNNLINENKEIIDLTKEKIEIEYPVYKVEIISANCSTDNAVVKVKITQGENIDKIYFSIKNEEEGGYPLIERYSVPEINVTKEYKLVYSEEDQTFDVKPNITELYIGSGGEIYFKDESPC